MVEIKLRKRSLIGRLRYLHSKGVKLIQKDVPAPLPLTIYFPEINEEKKRYTFEVTYWGKKTVQTACEHLLEIANRAIELGLYLTDDYGVGDSWDCPKCNCGVEMEELIYRLKEERK